MLLSLLAAEILLFPGLLCALVTKGLVFVLSNVSSEPLKHSVEFHSKLNSIFHEWFVGQ